MENEKESASLLAQDLIGNKEQEEEVVTERNSPHQKGELALKESCEAPGSSEEGWHGVERQQEGESIIATSQEKAPEDEESSSNGAGHPQSPPSPTPIQDRQWQAAALNVVCYACRTSVLVEMLSPHLSACLVSLDQFYKTLFRHPLCGLLAFPRPPKTVPPAASGDADANSRYSREAMEVFDQTLGGCKGCSSMYPVRDLPAHFIECPRRFFTTSSPCPIIVRLPRHDVEVPSGALAVSASSSPRVVKSPSSGQLLTPYKRAIQLYPPSPSLTNTTVARSPIFRSQQRNEVLPRCHVCEHKIPTYEERVDEEIRKGKELWESRRMEEAKNKARRDRRRQVDYAFFHPADGNGANNKDAERGGSVADNNDSLDFTFEDGERDGSSRARSAEEAALGGAKADQCCQTNSGIAPDGNRAVGEATPDSVEYYEEVVGGT